MTISSIVQWFIIAKPTPTADDCKGQIIYHVEEFIEMLQAINAPVHLVDSLTRLQESIRQSDSQTFLEGIDKVALLDALCDQIVTAIGVGVLMGFDTEKALAEVNRSNYTKFKPYDGGYLPYIRPDGKIGKNPDTYKEPELAQFLEFGKSEYE